MTITIQDNREPWLIELGRELAEAVEEERIAQEAARKASEKRMRITEDIARIGGYINNRLGSPKADKPAAEKPTQSARAIIQMEVEG